MRGRIRAPRGVSRITALTALACLVTAAPPLAAQRATATADYQPADYLLEIDGTPTEAEVWQSRLAGEMLILSDELPSPVRLVLREGRAETVQFMKVDKRADGGLTVLPEASDRQLGSFTVAPGAAGVQFDMDGRRVALSQKPPLLGEQDLAGMKAYSRDYVRKAEAYTPSKAFLEKLRAESRPVRVEVYFGTWCPFCQDMVPRMMRVAEELRGSRIDFDFYGLPQGPAFEKDPKVARLDIHGVPTGVVYIDGREIGRIQANGWKIPELSLNGLLVKN